MAIPLRVLFIDDSMDDVARTANELKRSGYTPSYETVATPDAMKAALGSKHWDVVLSEYSVRAFDAFAAMSILNESGIDIPFIIFSGHKGEESVAAAIRAGAHDYLMKDNLGRLVPAINRGMTEAVLRRKLTHVEESVNRANRALEVLSRCNRLLVHIEGREKEFLTKICDIIVGVGGYRMAWVGFAEQGGEKAVIPAAYAGFERGYLEKAGITWADTERGRGPTGTSIRTRKPCTALNILNDPKMAPWRKDAVDLGYASSIGIPLIYNGEVLGALTIYADRPAAFDSAEVGLLRELADDTAFGIGYIRMQKEKRERV